MPFFPESSGGGGADGPAVGIIQWPHMWPGSIGYDYWFGPYGGNGDLLQAVASATQPGELAAWDWNVSGFPQENDNTSADFISASDKGGQSGLVIGSSDKVISPAIFGDWVHGKAVQELMGWAALPTSIEVSFIARFGNAATNENISYFGAFQGAPATAASSGCLCVVHCNGSNFIIRGASNTLTGAASDASFHFWKFSITASLVTVYMDDVLVGTFVPDTDVYPFSVGVNTIAATNTITLAMMRVKYVGA